MNSEKSIKRDGLQVEEMWYQKVNFNRKSRHCILEVQVICSPLKNFEKAEKFSIWTKLVPQV
jgi:hypothetical protein